MGGDATRRLDFFLSHAGTDEDWATWIAQQLVNAGYAVELDVWNWSAGIDVIDATRRALDRASRVLAVWTPDYFGRRWADMEHRVSFAVAQTQPGWLLPVMVRFCPEEVIPRLYRTLIRVDLVGLGETEARARLLAAVAGPTRPTATLPYPGAAERGIYPGRLPPVWNVPTHNSFFTGRDGVLAELHRGLSDAGAATVVVVGEQSEGGVGKSGLAVEYAWRHAADYRLVWWVDAGHPATAEADLIELAVLLDVPAFGGTARAVSALFAELGTRADWLLILDDVADSDQLARLLPPPTGRVIVTSRDRGIGPVHQQVVVGRFSRTESVRLLRRRCPWLAQHSAARIAAIVADLPLAVAQAGAFLAQTGMGAEEYLPRLAEHATTAPAEGAGGDVGLAATVAIGLERLAALDPAAVDLLDQVALLAPEPVPLTAATTASDPAPGLVVGDPATTGEIVSSITGLGLARQEGTHIQLHARVHVLIAASLTGQRRTLALTRALRLLATADPGDPARPGHWPLYATLTPHVHAAVAHLADAPGVTETSAFQDLLDNTCSYLRIVGQAQASHDLAEVTHRRRGRMYGDDHPETLRWAMNRGVGLGALGHHEAARTVLADTLARQRRVVGVDHPETLRSADFLGVTLAALGEHDRARRLLADTLVRRRRTLGVDAAETLQAATDLGIAMGCLGYHEQARHVLEDAMTRRRQTLGPGHPDTLDSAHHLGLTLAALGDHEAARHVLEDAMVRRRQTLGPGHPDALDSAHHLGLALAVLGDHDAARHVLEDAMTRRRQTLGPDHPDALDSAHHLGLALAALGDHDAARPILDDTLERRRRVLGPSHPDTLHTEGSRRGPWPAAG